MKRFRFRLERLLDFRQRLEDAAVVSLAAARAEVALRLEMVRSVENQLANLDGFRLEAQVGGDWGAVVNCHEMSVRASKMLEIAKGALARAEAQEETAREVVVGRMRDRKVVASLKEKARTEYGSETIAAEQGEADDIATTRHGREV